MTESEISDSDYIAQGNALIRIIARKDPDRLSDEQWAIAVNESLWAIGAFANKFLSLINPDK